MRNFSRINNFYSRRAAWQDWHKVAIIAEADGHGDLVKKYQPPENASYQVVDARTAKLRQAIEQAQRTPAGQR